MKKKFVISDTHFGHSNIIEYSKRPFSSPGEMDEAIIDNWNRVVGQNDRVYLLGDVAMSKKHIPLLGRLNGKIILVMGNHDIFPTKLYLPYVEDIRGYVYHDGIIMSHIPIYNYQFERYIHNIHGHLHENVIDDSFYTNVCVEQINYTPIDLEELKEKVIKQLT
jgi:calcineurin-like phosphoesterase family protein